MIKRFLSILLLVCMIFTLLPTVTFAVPMTNYGIWVGSTQVTSNNASNVTGGGITGTVTYDAGTNTLTLDNASITSLCPSGTGPDQNGNSMSATAGIFRNTGDLKIVLIGTNTVDIHEVTGQADSAGIYSIAGNLSITSTVNGSLTLVGAPSTAYSFGLFGKDVTIEACTVTATAGSATHSTEGIHSGENLTIRNATVTGIGGTAGDSYGIVCIHEFTSVNSTVTGNSASYIGIAALNNDPFIIENSTVTATGNQYALYIRGTKSIAGSLVTASTNIAGTGATAVTIGNASYLSNPYKYVRIAPSAYTVLYDGNGATSGSVAAQSTSIGTATTVAANGFTKTGYSFNGWNTMANGNGTAYGAGSTIPSQTAGTTVTLYAQWLQVPPPPVQTYTVTYNGNGATSGSVTSQTTNVGTATTVATNGFTKTGFTFAGWNTASNGSGTVYGAGGTVPSQTAGTTVTLYAQWTENTYSVSGEVKDESNPISGASVKLMKGNTQIGTQGVTTAPDGTFTITGVPNGTYNLVVSKDGITVTTIVVINNSNNTLSSAITLPSGKTNSVVEVNGSETPQIVVGNLDGQFSTTATDNDKGVTSDDNTVVTGGGSVEIKLIAEKKDDTAANATTISAIATSNGNTVGIFIDLSVLKTVKNSVGAEITTQSAILTELPSLIEVLIPLPAALQGKANYVVYRYHGSAVDRITTTAVDGEKIELVDNNTTIKLTVKKFSTYAIAYTTPSPNNPGGSSGGGSSSSAASSTIAAVSVKESALPYYIKNGGKVYIGFSVFAGNLYKYIAPTGETVAFMENPKNFTDNTIAWAKASINFVTERELFLGITQDQFGPNESMTRAMFVTVIGRLYERSYNSVSGTSTFSDVDANAYYAKYVAWANENGIIKGIGENQFAPEAKVTREQMAVIMLNFADFLNKADVADSSLAYADGSSISSWAIDGAKYCQETKVITGREGGSFVPQESATRAEVAVVIKRFIKIIVE